ncbi:hypothetical protein D0T84_05360 [Dysgonomonas sp. 521]|uniref:N-acetylmuramoyl-L-alanine amidase n=1 Tax=Dysgonomonas sp. 521 TaxID=2302932 RepID=UPI0013D7D323|nr:N-acetylmuramoyl-L-alanine amidase [Dysgonomonas sp. 521]NDV94346.1 hypothetical protein [Dysgonomonas sp. 521]
MREIKHIIIHASATKEGRPYKIEDIDVWHKNLGWKKCGYHYVIELDGKIRKGRSEEEIGAHAFGWNKNSIGICYIGGLGKNGEAKDTRTLQQKSALTALLYDLKVRYPEAEIIGHRDTGAQKSCPCFEVREEYKHLNNNKL